MATLGITTLTGCSSIPDFIATGTAMTFQQTTAPTSWTKETLLYNDYSLRVVTGTASTGGSISFSSAFTSRTPTGSVNVSNDGVTLSSSQNGAHTHSVTEDAEKWNGNRWTTAFSGTDGGNGNKVGFQAASVTVNSSGSGSSHTHVNTATFSGNSLNFAVNYVDVIIATKN